MKKLVLAALLAFVGVIPVHADTIVVSNATTTNNTAAPTVDLTAIGSVNSAWYSIPGADWISVANTGDPSSSTFVTEPNGFNATYTDTFTLDGTITSASLLALSDDTTSVVLNGHTIYSASTPTSDPGNTYPTCSAVPIGCTQANEGVFTSAALLPYLQDGTNTISFTAYQEAGSSYGVDFELDAVSTPEPSAFLMLGLGLAGLTFMGSLRRRSTVTR